MLHRRRRHVPTASPPLVRPEPLPQPAERDPVRLAGAAAACGLAAAPGPAPRHDAVVRREHRRLQLAADGALPYGLEGHGVELVGQPRLVQREQPAAPVEHARVGAVLELEVKGVEEGVAVGGAARERGPVQRAARGLRRRAACRVRGGSGKGVGDGAAWPNAAQLGSGRAAAARSSEWLARALRVEPGAARRATLGIRHLTPAHLLADKALGAHKLVLEARRAAAARER